MPGDSSLFDALNAYYDAMLSSADGSIDGVYSLCPSVVNKSWAMAVHPRHAKKAQEAAKRRGVPTEFLPDGRPIFTSRAHQKAYLKAYGYRNNDGGYGD